MVEILMMSSKLVTLTFLKIKPFLNKVYDIIVLVHYIINKVLSDDSNYIIDVVI